MSIGMILLVITAILTLFGISQRVLDSMHLSDRMALLLIAAIFVGGLIPDISITDNFSFNIGGAVIPLGICVYLFIKAGTVKERIRAIAAALFRLLVPESKFTKQISLLIACVFVLVTINAVTGAELSPDTDQYNISGDTDYIGFSGDVNRSLQKKI